MPTPFPVLTGEPSLSFEDRVTLDTLDRVRAFVETCGDNLGVTEAALSDLKVAVDEAVTNIVLHGYGGEGGPLSIRVEADGGDVHITIRDRAEPFDPSAQPAPRLEEPLNKRAIGGMGLFLVRKMTDDVRFVPLDDKGNELRLVKRGAIRR
ncbi:MAG: ATP-binding protein [Proteobacteria bacterium]|nr:MAG: ATP-binding protein [Pseudomonadota bacterium]